MPQQRSKCHVPQLKPGAAKQIIKQVFQKYSSQQIFTAFYFTWQLEVFFAV